MNKPIVLLLLIVVSAFAFFYFQSQNDSSSPAPSVPQNSNQSKTVNAPAETVIVQGLDTPWAITFLPDGGMLVTERPGRVRLVDSNGNLQQAPVATLANVLEISEGGLLGIALHPNFSANNYVYFYYTYSGNGNDTINRVVRMKYENGKLGEEQVIVNNIPGAPNHNGGRIKFGPDGFLYITTGDAQEPSLAQDTSSLAGKILRVTDAGRPAAGNPFGNAVYSYGHRNPQGIDWDRSGSLFETEHGPSGGSLGTGNDEINKIEVGKNYGWPEIQGDQSRDGMVIPVANSTPNVAWAPAGAALLDNSLFYGGLRGEALYEAVLNRGKISEIKEHFKGELGRIREVIKGPDGMLYITTSNQDGRGSPRIGDDKIIKVNPSNL